MHKTVLEHKFAIGDKVKHNSKGSPEGEIVDMSYQYNIRQIKYYVSFGMNNADWYYESEIISAEK